MRIHRSCYSLVEYSAGVLVAFTCLCQPLAAQLGQLPAGYVSRLKIDGVRGEIGVTLLTDSSTAATFVPTGLTLITLQQIAERDSATAQYLASRPHLKTAVPSVLAFAVVDSLRINNRPPLAATIAFWWLRTGSDQSIDDRAMETSFIEAAFWTPDSLLVDAVRPYWPQAREASVVAEHGADGEWQVALVIPDGTIRGRCRPSGPRVADDYPLPAYSTVWNAGRQPSGFTVFTYWGHHSRNCAATWTAEGSNALVEVVNASLGDPPPWMATTIVDGWRAAAGVYRR